MKLEWIYENKVYNNICGENITIFFRFGAWLSYEKEILRFEEIWTRAVNIFDRVSDIYIPTRTSMIQNLKLYSVDPNTTHTAFMRLRPVRLIGFSLSAHTSFYTKITVI